MTRNKVMSGLLKILNNTDVVLCVGDVLLREACFDKYRGFIGVEDLCIDYFSVALGIAATSKHKVVVLCDDSYLLRHLNALSQIGVSNCTNLYIIIFRTGVYATDLVQKTISRSIRSLKGILFNFGVLVHDYTPHFKDARGIKIAKAIFGKSLGPLVITVDIDNLRCYAKGPSKNTWGVFKKYLLTEGVE